MKINTENIDQRFSKVRECVSWNSPKKNELRMHKIHVYPAKFPSFLISKSLEYARSKGIEIRSIGDIFCGCGTTALEAKNHNKEFWGCDINPVATLIAKVKREKYNQNILLKYYENIILAYEVLNFDVPGNIQSEKRLNYWFKTEQIQELFKLLTIIKQTVPHGKYQDFFLVSFSNILKRTSKWLTKSIKPQIDPQKPIYNIQKTFSDQFRMMFKAVDEVNNKISINPKSTIVTKNFLTLRAKQPFLDMLITSPPYVTSYEYADLHQLSTLWLGYCQDFKELRNGTIGSLYHSPLNAKEIELLDPFAKETYESLAKAKTRNAKAALKYFIDIKNTVGKSYFMIKPGGLVVFVIGNTTHKNVYIDNAKYLTKCILTNGFIDVEVFKRKISSKILTPYRDKNGKFSNNKRHRKIYNYEFVIIAKKPN